VKDHVGTQIKDQARIVKPEIAPIAVPTDGRQSCDVRHRQVHTVQRLTRLDRRNRFDCSPLSDSFAAWRLRCVPRVPVRSDLVAPRGAWRSVVDQFSPMWVIAIPDPITDGGRSGYRDDHLCSSPAFARNSLPARSVIGCDATDRVRDPGN
jgi:hypothetical protein